MSRHAQLALQSARSALDKALESFEDGLLRSPITFTVDPGPPRHPHDGPLDVRVDNEGIRLGPTGMDLSGSDAVHMTWDDVEAWGRELALHARIAAESEAMDADLRFLRRLYFRYGGLLRYKLRGNERRRKHSRIHDIRTKLHPA